MDRFRKLLVDGYFPNQLPSAFSTKSFALKRHVLLKKFGTDIKKIRETSAEHFSQARVGHRRRPLSIPNPICQLYLAKEIAANWKKISRHIGNSSISKSKCEFIEKPGRAIEFTPIPELREHRVKLSAGYRYVLQTDVSQYFPTIYTHTIPWALHTKSVAKKARKDFSLLGNRLDFIVSRGHDGQTIGIPIGPATSHILAEIIGATIDEIILRELDYTPSGYRHVDDFFFCFDSYSRAEEALAAVVSAVTTFQLQLNPSKTKLLPLEEFQDENWAHIVGRKKISEEISAQKDDIIDYFETLNELHKKYGDESIIKFALTRSTSFLIHEENWLLYEAYLARMATLYSSNLEIITRIFSTYRQLGYAVSEPLIQRLCNTIIREHAPLEHHSEVVWALYLARDFKVPIDDKAAKEVSKVTSSVCALVALDMREKGLIGKGLDTNIWDGETTKAGLSGPLWLYSYEAPMKGWTVSSEKNHIDNHPGFKEFKALGISFYDQAASIEPMIERIKKEEFTAAELADLNFGFEDEEFGYSFSDELEEYRD